MVQCEIQVEHRGGTYFVRYVSIESQACVSAMYRFVKVLYLAADAELLNQI